MRKFAGVVVALMAYLANVPAVSADDRRYSETPELGGAGGGQFKSYCPKGELLVGLEGRVGDYIDAIQPVCRERRQGAALSRGPRQGGDGGTQTILLCPAESYITGWQIARSEGGRQSKARWIRPRCETTTRYHSDPAVVPGQFGNGGQPAPNDVMSYNCYDGQFAVGVIGGSGAYIDRIGLMCEAIDGPLGPPATVERPPKVIGRVRGMPATGRRPSLCEAASDARRRNSPAAPNLEANCRAWQALQTVPAALPPATAGDRPAPALGRIYNSPMIEAANGQTVMLDYCRAYGSECGMPAANAFCELKGHPGASSFQISEDIGHTTIVSTGQICDDPSCDGFTKIQCNPD